MLPNGQLLYYTVCRRYITNISVCNIHRTTVTSLWELSWLDMNINFNKLCCSPIGPRFDIVCEAVTSSCNRRLPWVSNMRYLGVHFVKSRTLKSAYNFCRAMLCISAAISVMQCMSVRLSDTFVDHVKTNKYIFEIFSPSGSHTILLFSHQTGWRYSDGNPLTGASNAGGV